MPARRDSFSLTIRINGEAELLQAGIDDLSEGLLVEVGIEIPIK